MIVTNENLKKITRKIKLDQSRKRNALTIKAHEYQWHKNLHRNAKQKVFKTAKTIKHILEKVGENKNIWVIGAGYSLEENLNKFKENYNPKTDFVFSTDASLRFLINKIGIVHDFVFVLDSKKEGLRFFKDVDLGKINLVISSAIDKEFLPIVEKCKQIYGFHMYDPSLPDWGGDAPEPAHKLLPNLNYIVNKGNVFNLALMIASQTKPKRIYLIGSEYAYSLKDGKVFTRANVEEDGYEYRIGDSFCRMDKIIVVEKGNNYILTQKDYYGYSLITNEILKSLKCEIVNLSGGLLG